MLQDGYLLTQSGHLVMQVTITHSLLPYQSRFPSLTRHKRHSAPRFHSSMRRMTPGCLALFRAMGCM